MKDIRRGWIVVSVAAAVLFVCMEAFMIWYLLHVKKSSIRLRQCIRYSFVGFFFSGITPSATGGQPVQLYYMKKDKIELADSTSVLMIVAVLYKVVLVLMGLGIGIFWRRSLTSYLGNYIYLFWVGILLNVIVVSVLVFVMVSPNVFQKIVLKIERVLVAIRILKESSERKEKLEKMVGDYHNTIQFFIDHKVHLLFVAGMTVLQRICLFLPTYFVYRGMGLSQVNGAAILVLQASVYIAVDMLPLPGAQGITELMYKTVFQNIFVGRYLLASVLATRGINFYFLLVVSGVIALFSYWFARKKVMEPEM